MHVIFDTGDGMHRVAFMSITRTLPLLTRATNPGVATPQRLSALGQNARKLCLASLAANHMMLCQHGLVIKAILRILELLLGGLPLSASLCNQMQYSTCLAEMHACRLHHVHIHEQAYAIRCTRYAPTTTTPYQIPSR